MELSVFNNKGQDTGKKATLAAEVFGIEPSNHAVWLDVKQYLANQRQGTHKAKQRAEINKSTRKLHRQKGTGGARHGSIKSPLYIGGGRVFGPTQRDYSFKLNKQVKALARKSVLSARAKENNISIIEDFSFDAPKTKAYIAFLDSLSLSGTKTLFVVTDENKNVYLSGRNIPKTNIVSADELSTYALVNSDKLLISESALSKIETLLK